GQGGGGGGGAGGAGSTTADDRVRPGPGRRRGARRPADEGGGTGPVLGAPAGRTGPGLPGRLRGPLPGPRGRGSGPRVLDGGATALPASAGPFPATAEAARAARRLCQRLRTG